MPSPLGRRAARSLAALLALSSIQMLAPGGSASARQEDAGAARMKLVHQRLWHEPDSTLGTRLRIENKGSSPLEASRIQIALGGRVGSRSELHESFDDVDLPSVIGLWSELVEVRVRPGGKQAVSLQTPVSSLTLSSASAAGVYPLTFTLLTEDSQELASLTTQLVFYPSAPEEPLNLVPVLPVAAFPSRRTEGPEGVYPPGLLKKNFDERGWLNGWLEAAAAWVERPEEPEEPRRGPRRRRRNERPQTESPADLHLGLAPSPRLVEELEDIGGGFTRSDGEVIPRGAPVARAAAAALESLDALLQQPSVQPVLSPYAWPDLPTLATRLDAPLWERQISTGGTILEDILGLDQSELDWLLPPGSRIDRQTLEQIQLGSAASGHLFFSEGSLGQSESATPDPCPGNSPTFACPVRVRTAEGDADGFVTDLGLQERLSALVLGRTDRLELQRFFAETAMIREELPGEEDRVVQVTVPPLWHPTRRLAGVLLEGLAKAPWLRTLTPEEGLGVRRPRLRRLVDAAPRLSDEPPDDYFAGISNAETLLSEFAAIDPPGQLLERLRRDLLVAQSRMWWPDLLLQSEGREYAEDVGSFVRSEFEKIRINDIEDITLSSRRSPIQLLIFNETGYPVSLDVDLVSPAISIEDPIRQRRFEQERETLSVEVTAQTSGIYPLDIVVSAPREEGEGGYEIDRESISVRSTDLNQIALAITIGAFAFLVFFYVFRAARRRRNRGGTPPRAAPL